MTREEARKMLPIIKAWTDDGVDYCSSEIKLCGYIERNDLIER